MFFIARVVLHHTDSSDDYTDLHAEMETRGFSRTISNNSQARYRLPPGEYFFESTLYTTNQVADLARAAVAAVMTDENIKVKAANKTPSVLVTSSNDISWSGLTRVFTRPKP